MKYMGVYGRISSPPPLSLPLLSLPFSPSLPPSSEYTVGSRCPSHPVHSDAPSGGDSGTQRRPARPQRLSVGGEHACRPKRMGAPRRWASSARALGLATASWRHTTGCARGTHGRARTHTHAHAIAHVCASGWPRVATRPPDGAGRPEGGATGRGVAAMGRW